MLLMLHEYVMYLINVQHLQYVHEDQNQVNEQVNNVLMDVPICKIKTNESIVMKD
jgi:hypothetical protein